MKGYVQVYRNLHKDHKAAWDGFPVYSVRGDDGLVKSHTSYLVIHDCTFRVQKRGQQRVRDEGRKNVHAYVQGRKRVGYVDLVDEDSIAVAYDPYKNDTFIRTDTGEALTKAKTVIFGCGKLGKEVKAIL